MRLSQNRVEMASLLFHLQLKSFGFFSKKEFINVLFLKVSSFQTFSLPQALRGYFGKIMCNGQQAELNFNLLKPTKMEPLEVLVVLGGSRYGFHILRSLAAIFQATFIREQFSRSFHDFPLDDGLPAIISFRLSFCDTGILAGSLCSYRSCLLRWSAQNRCLLSALHRESFPFCPIGQYMPSVSSL